MAVNVFISYAPADRSHLEVLEAHLAALKRQGLVSTWHRGRIGAGAARDEEVAAALSAAEVVLLLVSEAFLASDSCYERELGRALERHRSGAVHVVPILVRACDWEGTALAALQVLPRDGGAVTSWANPSEAWREVVRGIRAAVEEAAARDRTGAAPGDVAQPGAGVAQPGAFAATLREAEAAIRTIDKQLAAAQKRRVRLQAASASTAEVDGEILELRRKRREGGQLHVGEELGDGRYLLLERIGRGGFATVWRALDAARGDQAVALKVLHPNLAGDEGRRERFFRGARAMAALDHPGVVRILEPKCEDGGWHYFVMELVHGEDVHSAVLGKRLPEERVIPMILRAGEAISFAHGRGLVHRDVKPANILLDAEGAPRITDFDLVWARDTTGGTRSGALGTFLYAAPELMQRPQEADARADVYGLGMTAVFCLHGAELPAIMMRYPGRVIERLPCGDAVRKVLERAIEFEASERFPDVASFCEALRSATAHKGRARQETQQRVQRAPTAIELAVQLDLQKRGPIRHAIERAILEPRAPRVQGPVMLAQWNVMEMTNDEEPDKQAFVVGSWVLMWSQHPVPGSAERLLEERGSFRCVVVEESGGIRPREIMFLSEFFEALLPWVDIPGGEFLMGSPNEDPEAHEKEQPQHHVEVAAFMLAATPVTVAQYAAALGSAARGANTSQPVTNVTWTDAIEFCNALSRLAGRQPCYTLTSDCVTWVQGANGFRLPQETEWEYACRAGTSTRYFFGDDERHLTNFAWYAENSAGQAASVGQKMPNPWTLHDMHGNVWEWTWNEYGRLEKVTSPDAAQERVVQHAGDGAQAVRGGSFVDRPKWLRSASRIGYGPRYHNEHLGFRCAGPARRKT